MEKAIIPNFVSTPEENLPSKTDKEGLRIVYMGTPDFAVEPLRLLVEGGYNIVGVITMPDKPIGRHQTELSQSPVKKYAVSQGLRVLQPERLKDETFVEELRSLQADLQIVVAFRMLPEVVWQMPRLGTFNLHGSLLPRYRGAAPINWAIINGDTETGITTFFLQHDIDTGNVIQQERIPITPEDNAETIHDQLMHLGARLVVETVEKISRCGKEELSKLAIPQEKMSLPVADYQRQAPKIFKDTCRIDWTQPAERVFNFVRGLSPYPGAWSEFTIGGKTQVMKIFKSKVQPAMDDVQTPVGELFQSEGRLCVKQEDGVQVLEEVQLAGKKRMSAADLLRGLRLTVLLLTLLILQSVFFLSPALAQQRRTLPQMRSALTAVMAPERAGRLVPVAQLVEGVTPENAHLSQKERTHTFKNLTVLTSPDAGFAVVSHSADAPAVLAYGEHAIDSTNVAPAFIYLMSLYEAGPDRSKSPRKVTYVNVNSMLTSHWAQSSPFNDKCPYYENTGKRSPTGCVATSIAQVLNYHKLPKKMRGYRTYTYRNKAGHYVSHNLDFAATNLDWGNMRDSYTGAFVYPSAAQKDAVATLMYACGVAASMQYGESASSAFPYNAVATINASMEGVSARMEAFSEETLVNELRAGHPVVYGGYKTTLEGHSFVVDGVTSGGKYRCNLGWGSSGDGEYAASDMNGYAYMRDDLLIISPSSDNPTCTPLAELRGLYASVRRQSATTLEAGRWYVLWNASSARSPYSRGAGNRLEARPIMPSGESTIYNADQLVRLVKATDGQYYLQTGLGDYIGTITSSGGRPATTSAPSAAYTVGSHLPGYFYLGNNKCYMRLEETMGYPEGWGITPPSDFASTSSWQLYPVALSTSPITDPNQVPDTPAFLPGSTYTLRNTGYSQGYLVATSEADAHPTLRGVTTDHSNGLYAGARYHDGVDMTSSGTYWEVETEAGLFYLRNVLTQKYLTNQGDKTTYVFTSTRTPINVGRRQDGTCWFNASNEAQSYLCAATHLENPAAFWEVSDAGCIWTVEQVDMPKPYQGVQSISISPQEVLMWQGDFQKLTATVLPEGATDKSVNWTSSNTAVVTIDATGKLTAIGPGTAEIRATSVDNPQATDCINATVASRTRVTTADPHFSPTKAYLIQNVGGTNAYVVGTPDNEAHPTLRGAEITTHPDGYYDEAYQDAPDLVSPFSYWQILTDGEGQNLMRNVGNQLYLTNQGIQTYYVYAQQPSTIVIRENGVNLFSINQAYNYMSYLCASTNTENPLGYWISNNEYARWAIYEVEGLPFTLTDPFDDTITHAAAPAVSPATQSRCYDLQGRMLSPAEARRNTQKLYIRNSRVHLKP